MIDILNSYLVQHKSINIPGFGTIYVERVPASTDFVNKQIAPPSFVFKFNRHPDAPDKEFTHYLASKKHVPESEAVKLYNEFAQQLRSRLKAQEEVQWPGVGVFAKAASGEIHFQPATQIWQSWEPIPAERVIRGNTTHAILVGDKEKTSVEMTELLKEEDEVAKVKRRLAWQWLALTLSVIGLIILLLHFSRKGFRWESIGNQHPIEMKAPG